MIKHKYLLLFYAIISIAFYACHITDEKFTTPKWLNGDGLQFPLRDDVLNDLVQHYKLKGMTYKQVQHLLGNPDGRDSVSFRYQIIETYNNMGNHNHVKNLVLYMGKDSIITKFEVYDWKLKKK